MLHVLVGNGDAHAKNYLLLHEPSGGLTPVPLYDVMSNLYHGDDRLDMYIDDVGRTERATPPGSPTRYRSGTCPAGEPVRSSGPCLSAFHLASIRQRRGRPGCRTRSPPSSMLSYGGSEFRSHDVRGLSSGACRQGLTVRTGVIIKRPQTWNIWVDGGKARSIENWGRPSSWCMMAIVGQSRYMVDIGPSRSTDQKVGSSILSERARCCPSSGSDPAGRAPWTDWLVRRCLDPACR